MKKIIAIQSNKLNEINIETDTTFLLALEAQKKDIKLFGMKQKILISLIPKYILMELRLGFLIEKKISIKS